MGVPYSTARLLAPASFIFDFAAQQYGIFSTPNMKDINDANLSFFSPQPYFIGAFFFPQQLFQLAWLYRLWTRKGTEEELRQMTDYVPVYALGNVCIGTWMFFWNANDLKTANWFVIANTLAQVTYVGTRLKKMNTKSTNSVLTHVVVKSFAGIGILDLLHNTSAAYFRNALPSTAVRVLTGAGFAVAGAASDWILGGCLVYDLVALAVGQASRDNAWAMQLGAIAVGCAGIVGARNWFMPPYVSEGEIYERVGQDDEDDVAEARV